MMSSQEDRAERARKLKMKRERNPIARVMNENRGAFKLRVINPKKEKYQRVKLDPKTIDLDEEE